MITSFDDLKDIDVIFKKSFKKFLDIVFILSKEGFILDLKGPKKVFENNSEKFIGNKLVNVIPEERGRNYMNALTNVIENDEVKTLEFELPLNDKIIFYEGRLFKLDDDTAMIVARDASNVKVLEKKLKESERRAQIESDNLRNILNSMENGVYIVDNEYDIVFANEAFKKEFGKVSNKKCYDYFLERNSPCENCINDKIFNGMRYKKEWTPGKNNKIYEIISTPIKNPDGSISKLNILYDLSKHKKALKELKESQVKYKTLTENLPGLVYRILVKEDNRMVFFNDLLKDFTGYKEEELTHGEVCSIEPLIHPKDSPRIVSKVKEAIQTHESFKLEYRIIKKNGDVRWFHESGKPIISEDGYINSIDGVILDITERKTIEKQLKQSEQKYRRVIDSMGDAINVLDTDLKYILFNKALKKWVHNLGFTSDLIGKRMPDVFPFITQKTIDEYNEVINTGKPLITTEKTIVKNRVIYTETRKIPIKIGDKVEQILTIVRDITERKKAEKKIEESEEKYRNLFNYMSSGVAVYEVFEEGEDFVFKDFNIAAEKIENIKKKKVIGRKVTEVFPGVKVFGIFDIFKRVWKTGKPERFPISLYKDNRISSWRESYVYKLPSGEIVAVYDDVTERKIAKQKLKLSEKKYKELSEELEIILDNIPDLIFYKDTKGNFLRVNQYYAENLGYTKEILEGKSVFNLYPQEIANEYWRNDREVIESGKAKLNFEEEWITSKGKRWLLTSLIPLYDDKNKVIGIIGFGKDITERKLTEIKLKESEEKFRTLVEEAPDVIFTVDKNYKILFINDPPAGLSREEVIGTNTLDYTHPEYI
ncbi:MAG: PAS domain S-box protein, partial [Candidatus Lokiarchaeota archaeon]|nr:PAS domain S-box protein [Candidatus Lokiarchaeota archaeon]